MKKPDSEEQISSSEKEKKASGPIPDYYVAIGASAGGLEAIETFFSHMPLNTGMAFIVIQHLSPDYKSLMVELLSKKTRLPVQRIENGMNVLPNHIYLIPPKTNLTIFHGKLLLREQDHTRLINLPIDIFMRSLAEDQGEKAVGIILSGTGSDGMRGVRAIKESGGMVMVQDENTAKFDGMPRSAISTGLADYILPPDEMPGQLIAFAKHPYMNKTKRSETLLTDEDKLMRIYAILREKCKLDFTYYKPSTVIRRIERRMSVNNIEDIGDYVTYLESYPGEAFALHRELLIGVTRFFRDPEVFEYISNEILPQIFKEDITEPLRFWVAGCSTGEEAYSIAILMQEYQQKMKRDFDIKIFATDVDRDALQFAASGIYPESIAADIETKLLTKYFQKKEDSFQIIRKIREMVVFAQHNLIKDPPFTNITMVSCRNLLIYLQSSLQRKVLEFFNFSINPEGFLILGTSETTGELSEFFDPLENKLKIYRSKGRLRPPNTPYPVPLAASSLRSNAYKSRISGTGKNYQTDDEHNLLERYVELVTKNFLPLVLIVNDQLEVIRIMGDTEGYFKLPSGKLVNDISKMAVKNLSIPLSTGISKALRQQQEVCFRNISLKSKEIQRFIELRIIPLPRKNNQNPLAAVLLNEMRKTDISESKDIIQAFDLSKETEAHFMELEQELQFTRENLQATIEELETSNEELQATNEELLASNEELQSTNEELQSTNEELFTVNAEYQSKIIELTELHNDIENLLETSQIGQILLDENMEVRRFSSAITKIFKILSVDIGRPITHIQHNLLNIDLIAVIRKVQKESIEIETEVMTQDQQWYIMKVVPYAIAQKTYSGTVLIFDNITRIKETHAALQESNQKFKILFETLSHGVVYQDKSGEIINANRAAEKILGLSLEQMKGRTSIDPRWKAIREDGSPFPGEEHPAIQALHTGKEIKGVVMGVFNPKINSTIWISINAVPQFKPGMEEPFEVHTTFDDITKLKNSLQSLQESEDHYRQLFNEMPSGFAIQEIILDEDGTPVNFRFRKVNAMFEKLTGRTAEEVINKTVLDVFPDIEPGWIERFGHVALSGENLEITEYNKSTEKWFEVHAFRYAENQFAAIFQEVSQAASDQK